MRPGLLEAAHILEPCMAARRAESACREVRAAWAAHEAHDLYPTMSEVRSICAELLPNAKVKKHLLWRYSIVWQKRNDNIG